MKLSDKTFFLLITLLALFGVYSTVSSSEENNSSVVANPYFAVISWVTDKPATSQVEYGTSIPFSSKTPEDTNLVVYHKVNLENLEPASSYQYRIISKDTYGNEMVSENFSFLTKAVPAQDQPPQLSDIEASLIVGAGLGEPTKASEKQKDSQQATSGKDPQDEANQLVKKEEPIEKVLMDKGGILLKKGRWQIDPAVSYVHTSANKIAYEGYTVYDFVNIGEISSEKTKRDIILNTITTRYGIKNDLQWEMNVPYRYQHELITVASTNAETNRSASGIGDVSTGVFYQCLYEKGLIPDMIAGISVKAPTGEEPYNRDIGLGTGHWGVKANLVAVKSSDPAILFSSLGYTYNFERSDIENYGTIKPGDTIDYGVGFAFALNYQIALSFSLSQSITQKMRRNDASIASSFSNVVNFKYGLTWSMSKNLSCEVSASHGLTTDSPDFVLGLSFPYTF